MKQPITVSRFDFLVALSLILATGTWFWPGLRSTPDALYVSPDGSNWHHGADPSHPLRTIQYAADRAVAGTHIRLLPGSYQERVHLRRGGTPNQLVILEADEPGTVSITWACTTGIPTNWTWRSEGDGIYSTETNYPIYRLYDGHEDLYRVPWGGLRQLRSLARRSNRWGAFCWRENKLHVALRNGRHPSQAKLVTHSPVPQPREWGEFKSANIWIEDDDIAIRGIDFQFGIGAGINIWSGQHIQIEDCAFSGATYGIKAGSGSGPSSDLHVKRCLYHNYPQWNWLRDWLSWEEIYASYSSSTLIAATDDNTSVESCLVAHFGDGLRLSNKPETHAVGMLATGNWLVYGTDDAIEFDGPACDVRFLKNVIVDCHESLSFSPVTTGPVRVEENLFFHPHIGLNGAQVKLLSYDAALPARNITVERNVFWGNWLCWWGKPPVFDMQVRENLFYVRKRMEPVWPQGVVAVDNRIKTVRTDLTQSSECHPIVGQLSEELLRDGEASVLMRAQDTMSQKPGPTWWKMAAHPATKNLVGMTHDWEQQ